MRLEVQRQGGVIFLSGCCGIKYISAATELVTILIVTPFRHLVLVRLFTSFHNLVA